MVLSRRFGAGYAIRCGGAVQETSGITVIVWGNLSGGIFDLYEIIPGFLFSTIAIVVGSKVGR